MRVLVEVPDLQIRELDALARQEKRSRAALIRDAIADLLAKHRSSRQDDAFGLWSGIDGLAHEDRLRREW